MKKGSTRFPDATRQTGGDSIVISHKPSMKLKTMSSVDGMDKSTCSSRRVKLPKKLLDDGHMINLVSVPRKSRSVLSAVSKKRHLNSSSPNPIKVISKCEMSSTDAKKKLKVDPDEQQQLITKDEVEAISGLLALAAVDNTQEINLNNKISEATASKPEDPVHNYVQISDLNESRNSADVKKVEWNESRNRADVKKDAKDVTDGNNSRKRCCSHVYICQIIKNLQTTKGKTVNSHEESKTKTIQEEVTNANSGINLNEMVSKTIFQENQPSGCRVQPYFGNPFCDPSQWLRPPVFPKQQMWMNPFLYKPPQSGSYIQPSLHDVLSSKQKQQQQQPPFKMQFDHNPLLGYDEKGVLFRGDSPTTLKLALQ